MNVITLLSTTTELKTARIQRKYLGDLLSLNLQYKMSVNVGKKQTLNEVIMMVMMMIQRKKRH